MGLESSAKRTIHPICIDSCAVFMNASVKFEGSLTKNPTKRANDAPVGYEAQSWQMADTFHGSRNAGRAKDATGRIDEKRCESNAPPAGKGRPGRALVPGAVR